MPLAVGQKKDYQSGDLKEVKMKFGEHYKYLSGGYKEITKFPKIEAGHGLVCECDQWTNKPMFLCETKEDMQYLVGQADGGFYSGTTFYSVPTSAYESHLHKNNESKPTNTAVPVAASSEESKVLGSFFCSPEQASSLLQARSAIFRRNDMQSFVPVSLSLILPENDNTQDVDLPSLR